MPKKTSKGSGTGYLGNPENRGCYKLFVVFQDGSKCSYYSRKYLPGKKKQASSAKQLEDMNRLIEVYGSGSHGRQALRMMLYEKPSGVLIRRWEWSDNELRPVEVNLNEYVSYD